MTIEHVFIFTGIALLVALLALWNGYQLQKRVEKLEDKD